MLTVLAVIDDAEGSHDPAVRESPECDSTNSPSNGTIRPSAISSDSKSYYKKGLYIDQISGYKGIWV